MMTSQNGHKKPVQPFLIDVLPPAGSPPDERRRAKLIVDKLLKVRRSLDLNLDARHYEAITRACEEIRAFARLTDTQREELILYSIEKQGASTATEIAEDTRLHISIVKKLLDKLFDAGVVYFPDRYVPLSGRQWQMIKSRRTKTPEAE